MEPLAKTPKVKAAAFTSSTLPFLSPYPGQALPHRQSLDSSQSKVASFGVSEFDKGVTRK
jgi:hypothetical protein